MVSQVSPSIGSSVFGAHRDVTTLRTESMEPSRKDGWLIWACWEGHTSLSLKKCGFLMGILACLMTIGILLPYIVSMALRKMPAFLPYISQAGGTPPMTGTLTVPLILMSFTGTVSFVLLYESLNHRNTKHSRLFNWANKLALATILLCCFGCVVVAANPLGNIQGASKLEWIITVGLEHGFGAFMVVIGTAFYQFILALVWYHLPDASKKQKCIKYAFAVIYVLVFITCVKPFPEHVLEEMGPDLFDFEALKKSPYFLPEAFTVNYQISAFCEWLVCILSTFNFLSLLSEFQRISFRITVRRKLCCKESAENLSAVCSL